MHIKGIGAVALPERVGAVAFARTAPTSSLAARRTQPKRVSLKCTKHSGFAQGSRVVGAVGTWRRTLAVATPARSARQPRTSCAVTSSLPLRFPRVRV
eukprot:8595601-Pyramimonas_sp.AAC.1